MGLRSSRQWVKRDKNDGIWEKVQAHREKLTGQDILISVFLDICRHLGHSGGIGFVCLVLGGLSFQLL